LAVKKLGLGTFDHLCSLTIQKKVDGVICLLAQIKLAN